MPSHKYRGTIVLDSLIDDQVLDNLIVIKKDSNLFTVLVPPEKIRVLADLIKPGWYMHFWRGNKLSVVLKNQVLEFSRQ